jgi:hypothetical protein
MTVTEGVTAAMPHPGEWLWENGRLVCAQHRKPPSWHLEDVVLLTPELAEAWLATVDGLPAPADLARPGTLD